MLGLPQITCWSQHTAPHLGMAAESGPTFPSQSGQFSVRAKASCTFAPRPSAEQMSPQLCCLRLEGLFLKCGSFTE